MDVEKRHLLELLRIQSRVLRRLSRQQFIGNHADLNDADAILRELTARQAVPSNLSDGLNPIDVDRWLTEGGAAHGDDK